MTQDVSPAVVETYDLPLTPGATIRWRYLAAAEHRAEWLAADGQIIGPAAFGVDFRILPDGDTIEGVGVVSLVGAAPEAAHQLRVYRNTTRRQPYGAPTAAKGVEASMDRLALALQETGARADAALVLTSGSQTITPQPGRALIGGEGGTIRTDGPTAADIAAAQGYAETAAAAAAMLGVFGGTRAALVGLNTLGAFVFMPDGASLTVEGLVYVKRAGSTLIPDLHGFEPGVSWQLGHFATLGADATPAFIAAIDAAVAWLMGGAGRYVDIGLPAGVLTVSDEIFSPAARAAIWNNVNLGSAKGLSFTGLGSGVSKIQIAGWPSAVRTNPTVGPFAGLAAEPSALFRFQGGGSGNPMQFQLRGVSIIGSGLAGKDPIAVMTCYELGGITDDVRIENIRNTPHMVHGSFNSTVRRLHSVSSGFQTTSCGRRLGGVPGTNPTTVTFTLAAGGVLTAQSGGSAAAYFSAADVGKTVIVQAALLVSGTSDPQPLRAVIASYQSASQVTLTIPVGYVPSLGAAKNMSWPITQATTTADSAVVTLDAPVLWGSGAADMIGQIVSIPKAGSKAQTDRDVLTATIIDLGGGNDTDGYITVTLSHPARFGVTDDFIVAPGHHTATHEHLMLGAAAITRHDDTDHIMCRWENGIGGSVSAVLGTCNSAVQYVACKFHGNTAGNSFAGEGSLIIDNARELDLIACEATHMGVHPKGNIRRIGWRSNISAPSLSMGGYRLTQDYIGISIDPMSGYPQDGWTMSCDDIHVANLAFPVLSQKLVAGRTGLNAYAASLALRSKRGRHDDTTILASGDDLNTVFAAGQYSWGSDAPSNIPSFGSRAGMIVVPYGASECSQIVTDRDNAEVWVRHYTSAWSPWRPLSQVDTATTADLAALSSAINATGKYRGKPALNTTTGALYVASGAGAASAWWVYNRDSVVTPS